MSIARPRGPSFLLGVVLALFVGLAVLPAQAEASFTIYDNTPGGPGPLGYGDATSLTSVFLSQLLGTPQNPGYYLVIDDKVFYNFNTYVSVSLVGGATPIAASSIAVTPLDANPLDPGIQFNGGFLVNQGQKLDTSFNYTAKTLNGAALIEDASLSLGGTTFSPPFSSITVGETVRTALGVLLASPATFAFNAPPVGGTVADTQFFAQPVNLVTVAKDILLDASLSVGSPATQTGFTTMTQNLSELPEPSTMAIAGLGALGMIGYGLRRRKGA